MGDKSGDLLCLCGPRRCGIRGKSLCLSLSRLGIRLSVLPARSVAETRPGSPVERSAHRRRGIHLGLRFPARTRGNCGGNLLCLCGCRRLCGIRGESLCLSLPFSCSGIRLSVLPSCPFSEAEARLGPVFWRSADRGIRGKRFRSRRGRPALTGDNGGGVLCLCGLRRCEIRGNSLCLSLFLFRSGIRLSFL